MRTLTLTAAGLAASALLAFSAQAATLTMVADKSTYNIGETITITVTGNSGGAAATNVIGLINYDSSLSTYQSGTQSQYESFGGFVMWSLGTLFVTPTTFTSFDQIGGLSPLPVSNDPLIATATLLADAAGVINFSWLTTGTDALDFFGLTNAAGTSVTIVPEPTTAALLGIGLLGLAVAGRRR